MSDLASQRLHLLLKLGGTTELIARVGQMLLPRGQVPPGCYVLICGTLVVADGLRMQFVKVAWGAERVLVPPVDELDCATRRSVYIEMGTHLMYLPRSSLLSEPGTARAPAVGAAVRQPAVGPGLIEPGRPLDGRTRRRTSLASSSTDTGSRPHPSASMKSGPVSIRRSNSRCDHGMS
jgi:hypothetical protein